MRKILIANRGEIASRIISTCKKMGIRTVAVYSKADEELPFVKEADEAFFIGEPPVRESYLNMDKLFAAAEESGADAIHPGYGLLSENSRFAAMCEEKGIVFIGPAPRAIEMMGDKIRAIETMRDAGVSVLESSGRAMKTVDDAIVEAGRIGYPVMLKASGGGGGIGMGRCSGEDELRRLYDSVKKRASAYFGNSDVFIEKFVEHARHIEVQIFGDAHGSIVHLFERNCSIQRRNQKVIEEAPSPELSDEAREKLYGEAVAAAKTVGYENAGTVEFIVDSEENCYFLEMNTRLQVEHPVTEAVTGIDLVEWQIKVARGERLPLSQAEISRTGHAIEFRVYAENPENFLPSPGKISEMGWPEGARIDSGYTEGNTVTPYYDPLIAKCTVKGEDRKECLEKAASILGKVRLSGIKTNIPFIRSVIAKEAFIKGDYDTATITHRKEVK